MKGYDILKKAALRAGISESDALSNAFAKKAAEFINQIANDLKIGEIASLSEEILCTEALAEALCCGVTMLISLDINDSEKNSVFTDIYNSKRAAALSQTDIVADVLPKPYGGGTGGEI